MSHSYASFTGCVLVVSLYLHYGDSRLELKAMTIDLAYASFAEDTLGSITPGKRADFVVLSQDIMTVSADQILKTRVQATFIDGELVYGSL